MLKTSNSSSTFLYFAYGANMLSRRLTARAPSAVAIDIGFVEGRRFSFGKVSRDKSGKSHPNLDIAEGLGIGYSETNIQVVTATGVYTAQTYVASFREDPLLPFQWYKASVVAGAVEHDLPFSISNGYAPSNLNPTRMRSAAPKGKR